MNTDSLNEREEAPERDVAPPNFKWPKPTLAGYDYALSMAELNGFDNVTDAIITAVRLRDTGIGLIQVIAEEIAADLGYQGGTENQRALATAINGAMDDAATRMRDACVAKVRALSLRSEKYPNRYITAAAFKTRVERAIESLTLDSVQKDQPT